MKRQAPLGSDALTAWSSLAEVQFLQPITTSALPGRGLGVVATADIDLTRRDRISTNDDSANAAQEGSAEDDGEAHNPNLMLVPRDLVLSVRTVWEEYATSNRWLREVLEAVGDFGKTPRGAILIFLLHQLTTISPDFDSTASPRDESAAAPAPSIHTIWTPYTQFIPSEIPLPTTWSTPELALIKGTSLAPALRTKTASLEREWAHLQSSTEHIPWCQACWWDNETATLDDWKVVDAMYRSRALDLPGTGHAMVPVLDMANHAAGEETVALYETDMEGNAVLQLREGKTVKAGEEITITYGDDKGACEMIFSYGFIENTMTDAKQLFLDLDIPDDDPLKLAKKAICTDAPGFRLFSAAANDKDDAGGSADQTETTVSWEGDYIWWICVNEEDGLEFKLLQTNEGERELQVMWKNELLDAEQTPLKAKLMQDPLWDVFRLRAVVMLQDRIESQFLDLRSSDGLVQQIVEQCDHIPNLRGEVLDMALRLRDLEASLLERGYLELEQQKKQIMESSTVQAYLSQMAGSADAGDSHSRADGAAEDDPVSEEVENFA